MADTRSLLEWLSQYESELKGKRESEECVYETSVVVLTRKPKNPRKLQNYFDKKTKETRFKEEKGICQWCHLPILGRWHAHHITPKSQGGDSSPKNLMVLHPECHLNPIAYEVLHPGMELPRAFNLSRWRIA